MCVKVLTIYEANQIDPEQNLVVHHTVEVCTVYSLEIEMDLSIFVYG